MKTINHDVVEIDGDETEQVLTVAAAVDVAKASGMVCVRYPHPSIEGRRMSKVWEVDSTTNSLLDLGADLVTLGVERVVLESTSDYWRPFFYLLEAAGLAVWLVNARDVKQVTGRPKTDKLDAVWLAKLNERGMLRASSVPPREIRALRSYTRLRTELVEERSRHKQRLEKLLEDALIKLSSVATDLLGVSARAMIEALIAGERDPKALADLALGKLKAKRPALLEALNGRFDDHHAEIARVLLNQIDACTDQIDRLTGSIEALIAGLPDPPHPGNRDIDPTLREVPVEADPEARALTTVERLDEIPGIPSGPRKSSSPRSAWTCPNSPPRSTWCRGPSCHPRRSSPDPRPRSARPARATATSRACSAKSPPPRPRPTRSSVPATVDSSAAGASNEPSSP